MNHLSTYFTWLITTSASRMFVGMLFLLERLHSLVEQGRLEEVEQGRLEEVAQVE
ncbi:hypothetical protein Hanom_Chr11g01059061 [Helianthus anomalus]